MVHAEVALVKNAFSALQAYEMFVVQSYSGYQITCRRDLRVAHSCFLERVRAAVFAAILGSLED